MLVYCLLWHADKAMRGDASHQLRPEGWPIFASTDRFQHLTSNFQTGEVCNMIFEEKTTYTDCSYWFQVCMHVHNNGSRGRYDAHFSQLPHFPSVFRAKRIKEEFAKTFPDKRAAGPLAGWALSHTFCRSVIGLRALPPWHSPTTGEKFENHQTAKWSKWPTICPVELIWVVYLSRNV